MGTTLCTSKKQGTILNFLLSLAWRITKCEILLISLLTYHPSGRQLWKEKQVLLWSLRMKSFRGSWNGMIYRMPMKPNATVQSECPILLRAIVLNVSESSKLFKITEFFFHGCSLVLLLGKKIATRPLRSHLLILRPSHPFPHLSSISLLHTRAPQTKMMVTVTVLQAGPLRQQTKIMMMTLLLKRLENMRVKGAAPGILSTGN